MPQVFQAQEYAPLYVSVNGTPQTEVDSITVKGMSGASDVETIMREWAGVVKGAARMEVTLKCKIPYKPTDQSGVGFDADGITAGGMQLDSTMITSLNQNGNTPLQFIIGIGGVTGSSLPNSAAAQQLMFQGFIKDYTVDYAVGKAAEVTFTATGKFQLWA